jgi:hypothetical protein
MRNKLKGERRGNNGKMEREEKDETTGMKKNGKELPRARIRIEKKKNKE